MSRLNELRLISRVAQMYHIEGRRQAEIAHHLRLSQATVSRMLKRAEAEDIVRTSVIPPVGTYSELEGALRDKYSLPEAIVVECTEDRDGAIMARIGEAAAIFWKSRFRPARSLGFRAGARRSSRWSKTSILKRAPKQNTLFRRWVEWATLQCRRTPHSLPRDSRG